MAQSRLELFLALKNKMSEGLTVAQREVSQFANTAQTRLSQFGKNFTTSFSRNLSELKSELPIIDKATKLARNPLVLAAAGAGLLYRQLDKATEAAANFNSNFRELANLNTDKSIKELNSLKKSILSVSFNEGFDANQTSQGFLDVQSTTGKYGEEVKKIVEKQGRFAKLLKADFNAYIEGTAKAMANYKFSADELDKYNRSSFAVQDVGVISFDEIAKVQSVFAGSAASASQNYDTANKILALFTIKTKSAATAATLTKSMFNDLTKPATIKALKEIGISMYDANGQIKQADRLMLELNTKFRGMKNDAAIIKLKNQFTGSDGLISMVQTATDQTGELQRTLSAFEDSKINMDVAINLAENDLNYIKDKLKNKLSTLQIELGEELLPIQVGWTQFKIDMVQGYKWAFSDKQQQTYNDGWTEMNSKFGELLDKVGELDKETYDKAIDKLFWYKSYANDKWTEFEQQIKDSGWYDVNQFFLGKNAAHARGEKEISYMNTYYKGQYEYLDKLIKEFSNKWIQTTNYGKNVNVVVPKNTVNANDSSTDTNPLTDGINAVKGATQQVKNFVVNINRFWDGGVSITNTAAEPLDYKEITDNISDGIVRTIRGIETGYN